MRLRRHNLIDTETDPVRPDKPKDFDVVGARTPDGTFNDLSEPQMGAAGARFARNVALSSTYGETAPKLFDPSPRLISNKLLARHEFVPVPYLNVLVPAWIQFMVHDWLSHGKNVSTDPHVVPLPDGDDWPGGEMTVPRTRPDCKTGPNDADRPPTFRNVETSWWDGSQIYGSSAERLKVVRAGGGDALPADGKIQLGEGDLLPIDAAAADPNIELAGVNGNWWVGLSVLHTLFAREHNAVVDRLKVEHPEADGEWLFNKARLVVSALIAKIHTVEWTPALMNSPVGRAAMRGNYWGIAGERTWLDRGRLSESEVVSGIPGSPQEHHGAPYAMTEEFAAVYRLHSLMPDDFKFRSADNDAMLFEEDLHGVAGGKVPDLYRRASFNDVLYSLATMNCGALVLNNYPHALRRLPKSHGKHMIDLAAVDILRDRERGVPRFSEFRRLTGMRVPKTFADITDDEAWQKALEEVYGTVDKVDLLIGTLAESKSTNGQPPGFGFSDTAFRIFILMASRRLKSDRFFTDDFRPEIYTRAGFDWVTNNGLKSVIDRHAPALSIAYKDARNPFFLWRRAEVRT
ncbi:MAG: peroxidase family protein [Pseudomonadota bacterium]